MRIAAIDRMTPSMPDFSAASIRIEQVPARRTTGFLLAALIALAAILLSPLYLIATAALADQGVRETVTIRPLALVQIMTGMAFWIILLGFPIYRLIDTLTRSRTIEIASGSVTVTEHAFGGTKVWTAPLLAFHGLAPYLRASLSGVRHELILIHPDRRRSLLVAMAPRLLQSDVDRIAAVFRLRVLAPQAFRRGSFVAS